MDNELLGKVLASIVIAATNLGGVTLTPGGVVANPQEIQNIVSGFLQLWLPHAEQKIAEARPTQVGGV